MKNYSLHEASTMNFSLYIKNIKALASVAKYQPSDTNVLHDMSSFLKALHVDFDDEDPVLYDVPSCSLLELKGTTHKITLTYQELNALVTECTDNIQEETLLYFLFTRFTSYTHRHPRKFRNNFLAFISFALDDIDQFQYIINEITRLNNNETYNQDLIYLQNIVNPKIKNKEGLDIL